MGDNWTVNDDGKLINLRQDWQKKTDEEKVIAFVNSTIDAIYMLENNQEKFVKHLEQAVGIIVQRINDSYKC